MRHLFPSLVFTVVLTGCGDPLRNVPRIADVVGAGGGTAISETPSEARQTGGLFGRLLDRDPDDQTNAAVAAALRDAGAVPLDETESENASNLEDIASTSDDAERPRRGLGGLFNRNNDDPDVSDAPRRGPDASDVEPQTELPLGQIARVCGLSQSELGTRIEGGAGFAIYDTFPETTAPRPFYITGFQDDCARTFTGAVVIPGDVETHEFVRYQTSNESIDFTTVDNAYEALKASVCRVGRGQPCGARTDKLNQNTYFITVYGFFGITFNAVPTKWTQILLHDGEVLAVSLKEG